MSDVDKVRVLIGDNPSDPSKQQFADADLQTFLDMEMGELGLAAADALDVMAAKADANPRQFTIGKFQHSSGRVQIRQLTQLAEAYRQRVYNTPAFGVIEQSHSEVDILLMLRNQILRNYGTFDIEVS